MAPKRRWLGLACLALAGHRAAGARGGGAARTASGAKGEVRGETREMAGQGCGEERWKR